MKHIIRRLSTAGAGHKLHDDGRISRNMFREVGDDRPGAPLSRAAGRATADERDRLTLIERGLRGCQGWSELKDEQRAESRGPERPSSILHAFLLLPGEIYSLFFQRNDDTQRAHRRGTACRAPTRDDD